MLRRIFAVSFGVLFLATGCALEDALPDQGERCAGFLYVVTPGGAECRKEDAGECVEVPHLSVAFERGRCPKDYLCSENGAFCFPACSGVMCGGQCIDPMTDKTYCGASGDCRGGNVGVTCAEGYRCKDGKCEQACLGEQILCNGKCVSPDRDSTYCGASGDCEGVNAGETCESGHACQGGTCKLSCPSNLVECGGVCVNLTATNMSACGVCLEGFADCDNNLANGCEVNGNTDARRCGASGDCQGANAGHVCASGTSCQEGVCRVGCLSGQLLCEDKCITPATDNTYCGASGDCLGSNAGEACATGYICREGECEAGCPVGQDYCDGRCVDLNANNMSACGTCKAGFGNCDNNWANGCEVRFSDTNRTACTTCASGFGNCDNDWSNGCEVNTSITSAHCGTCGNACPSGGGCTNGVCQTVCGPGLTLCDTSCRDLDAENRSGCNTCKSGFVSCGGSCINPQIHPEYCGARLTGNCTHSSSDHNHYFGVKCASNQACQAGKCQNSCLVAGQVICNKYCIDPNTSNDYCGASGSCAGGVKCASGESCKAGKCTPNCPSPQIECGGVCKNPTNDENNCGECGKSCDAPNAALVTCTASTCYILTCDTGYTLVDGACVSE